MTDAKRSKLGKKARQFVIDNFSIDVIGARLEEVFDSLPFCQWDFDFSEKPRDPNYTPPFIENDSEWLIDIYENVLNMEVCPEDDGHKYWQAEINKKGSSQDTREGILGYFRQVADKENKDLSHPSMLEDFLDEEGPERRIAVVIPGSAGDVLMVNSLLKNLKKLYPSHNIYIITEPSFYGLIEDNPAVHRLIPYSDSLDDLLLLEGSGSTKGFFDIAFLPHVGTQKIFTYQHNGKDKTQFSLLSEL